MKCMIGGCGKDARYEVGIDKLKVCLECFENLPDFEKAELYYNKRVKKVV